MRGRSKWDMLWSRDPAEYQILAEVEDGDDASSWTPAAAALLLTEEGYWAAEHDSDCSCFDGVKPDNMVAGPCSSAREALQHVSPHLRAEFPEKFQ